MTSAKLEANRRNAQKSAGPRTAEGKTLAAPNATRHGLLAGEALLPDDDFATFEAFAGALRAGRHRAPEVGSRRHASTGYFRRFITRPSDFPSVPALTQKIASAPTTIPRGRIWPEASVSTEPPDFDTRSTVPSVPFVQYTWVGSSARPAVYC